MMNDKRRRCVHVNEISSVFLFKKYENVHWGEKTCTRAKKTCIRAKKTYIWAKKNMYSAEKSVHLGEFFKLNLSNIAFRDDVYINKKSVT